MCHFPAAVKREASVETGDTIAFLYGRGDAFPEQGVGARKDRDEPSCPRL